MKTRRRRWKRPARLKIGDRVRKVDRHLATGEIIHTYPMILTVTKVFPASKARPGYPAGGGRVRWKFRANLPNGEPCSRAFEEPLFEIVEEES